jgi:antitoxin component of RelBE/YafQ-DinJ toxin-antitoxin module
MGNTTTLTVRLDSDIKDAARRRAERLGVSLSTLVENDLRRFINGHPIIIDDDSFVPPARLLADIDEAEGELARGETNVVLASQVGSYLDALARTNQ